jgi:tRNA A37 threonylcarbamoyladenosine dehydratase
MNEHRFSRMQLLVGASAMDCLAGASVAVFGIGGVGSYAVEALARAGIGSLTLVDFDDICATNINRQIHSLDSTIGRSKVEVMAERCRQINPDCRITPKHVFYHAETAPELLPAGYDYLLDCIDHISAKLHLIESCVRQRIPVISSMGAANKLDPTQIKVADISATEKCRLARIIRKELRSRGINQGVQVVYSTEEFRPLRDEAHVCADNCICTNREEQRWNCNDRRVTLGSSSYIPPIFGLTMAGVVIQKLIGESRLVPDGQS